MKTAVIFYSWSGHTKKIAEERAEQEAAQLFEIKDLKRPNAANAYTSGCFAAMRMKSTPVESFEISYENFDKLIIMAPIWAGKLAPAINNVFDTLPSGKNVVVCGISASGSSRCRNKVADMIRSKGSRFISYEDIKG